METSLIVKRNLTMRMKHVLDNDPDLEQELHMAFVNHKVQKTRHQNAKKRLDKAVCNFSIKLFQLGLDTPVISEADMKELDDETIAKLNQEYGDVNQQNEEQE